MKLYYTKRSPYARKAHVIALEKNVSLELIEEDLANKSEELLRLNPTGKIPVLQLDNGQVLTDSTLINAYLINLPGGPSFFPKEEKERLTILNLDAVSKSLTDVTVASFYERLLHKEEAHQKFLDKCDETIHRTLTYFEDHVRILASDFHLAAIGVACSIGYIEFRLGHLWPAKNCSKLQSWYEKIGERSSFVETGPIE